MSTEEALADCCDSARDWPLPGSGRTGERLKTLASVSRRDLVLGRLVEAHADACAITSELGGPPVRAGTRWGVWAAGPARSVTATLADGGWVLSGTKIWCSGATLLTHALIDAAAPDGQRLFAVALAQQGVDAGPPIWVGPGMRRSDTRSVTFSTVPAEPVGGPGEYLARPGFWAGAVGVAACWYGGAVAVADRLAAADRLSDPHWQAALGGAAAALYGARGALSAAAARIDASPGADHSMTALACRSVVERAATEVIDRAGRALGPGPLAHDAVHAATVVDLAVYIRQHHGDRDLADLGRRLVACSGLVW
jgi:alkylation response protein AidB-like acyl-CoA dehydrogenase